jgi:4-carboxymuconolactone decarboxylase
LKGLAATIASLLLITSSSAEAQQPHVAGRRLALEDARSVAPALERYTQDRLLGEVWKRPGLSARDRSIVTLAALAARNQSIEMPFYLDLALESGVRPAEISELVTHLAFYSGWADAASFSGNNGPEAGGS